MHPTSIQYLISKAHERANTLRRLPESTYRLQFHRGFTFNDATAIIPYLAELGITHVYASPYLRAAPGSTHGYDVIDHCRLNPEFGTQADYDAFVNALADHCMSHILDTVPNHVGIATNENNWWNDVLEHGPASRYGGFFDIAWQDSPRPELHDRVLVPILGQPYAKALEEGQLKLSFTPAIGSFSVTYFQRIFPVNPSSYGRILERCAAHDDELRSIITSIHHLPSRSTRDPLQREERRRETAIIKHRLATLVATNTTILSAIYDTLEDINGHPDDPHSFDGLDDLLSAQCYRLAYWHIASDEINYRRFFDINDLAAMVMERQDVFEETHALTLGLLAEGKVAGLRIDHPDGLYDPEQYFRRLQAHFLLACARDVANSDATYSSIPWEDLRGSLLVEFERQPLFPPPLYVLAEKILAVDERLPRDWSIDGTSGYHFLNLINGLFVDAKNAQAFTDLYTHFVRDSTSFEDLVYQKKRLILETAMSSELHMLAHRLARLAQKNRRSRDFTFHVLRDALAETIACFPVYRTYITGPAVHEVDRHRIDTAIKCAVERNPHADSDVFAFLRETLMQNYPDNFTDTDRAEQLTFAGKFQQLSAPVTAKGVEDTAFYIFNRLVPLNEVGGDPARFGIAPADLHHYLAARQKSWPYGLSASSTHDTKRSEDVRARLNVLSEIPNEWQSAVIRWNQLTACFVPPTPPPTTDLRLLREYAPCAAPPPTPALRYSEEPNPAPSKFSLPQQSSSPITPNELYLLFQSLLGAWPLELSSPTEHTHFIKRIQAYMQKAMREAKITTSWTEPNTDHEKAVEEFVAQILGPGKDNAFLADFIPFQKRIAHLGLLNSLSQTVMKLTSPGVPDTYQGTELWDFSLVDPDNRRPVDYAHRRRVIEDLHALRDAHREDLAGVARDLLDAKEDGRIKFWITRELLHARRAHPGLFTRGDYLPLEVTGPQANHVFAFARLHNDRAALVIVPRLLARLVQGTDLPLGHAVWAQTRIVLPECLGSLRFRNIFAGTTLQRLDVAELLAHLPVGVLLQAD